MKKSEELVARITALENSIKAAQDERAALVKELAETPAALLDRDPEADRNAEVERMNRHLEEAGLLPKSE